MTGRDDFAGYPDGDFHKMPADLAAVQADDALLDILGSGGTPGGASDELTRLLASWRSEVHAEPFRELVDTNTALAVIRAAARQPVRRRNPVFGSLAAAAAVLVIAFAGVGLVAKQAQPGDHLWGVTQVLYGDYARSVETAAAVRTELNEARTALQQNKPEKARASLQRVQQQLPVIGETEGRTDLIARHRELDRRVEQILQGSSDGGSGNPPTWPASPPASTTRDRLGSTPPQKTSQQPPSDEPSTTPNPTTEPQSSTSPTSRSKVPPGPGRGHSSLGPPAVSRPPAGPPREGPPPAGPSSSPREGSSSGASPDDGASDDGPSPGDPQGGRSLPGAGHPNPGIPPVCDRPTPRSPYC